jgi:hypothetical protein
MLSYWWLMLFAAGIMFGAGAILWMNAATAMVRVVAPSTDWIERESQDSIRGARAS